MVRAGFGSWTTISLMFLSEWKLLSDLLAWLPDGAAADLTNESSRAHWSLEAPQASELVCNLQCKHLISVDL